MLLINEEEVRALLPVAACVDVLDQLFADAGAGKAAVMGRQRIPLPQGTHQIMGGTSESFEATGLKTYVGVAGGGGTQMVVLLFGTGSPEPVAMIAANALGQIRTGAASGVATRHMAKPNASTVGIIGSGYQARTQLAAVWAARPITQAWVYSRSSERREAFADDMSEELGIAITATDTPEAAVRDAAIVCVITNAREPVVDGDSFSAGVHINAAGSNSWARRELDETAVRRSNLVVVDDLAQAKMEAGDLIWAAERRAFHWEQAVELGDVVVGRVLGRPHADAITLFESQGIGTEDVAAGMYVYRRAQEQGLGREVAL
jgi:ornithine cyclodeaminase/alanine dehydrogenase-like protein (mu-crystallin family)